MRIMFFVLLLTVLMGCSRVENNSGEYTRFNFMSINIFDTITNIVGYTATEEEFNYYAVEIIYNELTRLFRLFDAFNEYPGINNIYTINKNAGRAPVEVDCDIIELLKIGKEAYELTNGAVNITIGPVTKIWREYINTAKPILPCMDVLRAANEFTNINNIIIDEERSTVFLPVEGMLLDVGSIGKGYAIERTAQKAMAAGFESFIISIGGDIRLADGPRGGTRDTWGVGVLDPYNPDEFIHSIFAANTAVFTSGGYLRYYEVDGVKYHHIIDPITLMPANRVNSVTIVHPDGITAEILSLAAFITGEDGITGLLEELEADAIFIY